jgi:hypothetical protein
MVAVFGGSWDITTPWWVGGWVGGGWPFVDTAAAAAAVTICVPLV